jgi:hypothetical protein
MSALTMFGKGVQRIIAASPSLRLLPLQQNPEHGGLDEEELAQPTIFPFAIRHDGRVLSLDDCRKVYRALAQGAREAGSAMERGRDPAIAAKVCLVGQPVALGRPERQPGAALRICADARLVTGTWSSDQDTARGNLQRELGRVGAVIAKIEWLLSGGHRSLGFR